MNIEINTADDGLCIVVPAFRATYLREALASIAAQTDTQITCHVFDDAGESGVARVCAEFPAFNYTRFDENLGGKSLVAQWNRCLAQVRGPWVWLFSDDDVMAPNAVQAFKVARQRQPECAVFQFALEMVSADLQRVFWSSMPPALESSSDFLGARLAQRRLSCLPEHVFHLPTLRALNGGFVSLPLAWNADDATWALLGQAHGIGGIQEAKVLWRQSAQNISNAAHLNWEKLAADVEYLHWLAAHGFLVGEARKQSARWLGTRLVRLYQFGVADLPRLLNQVPAGQRRALAWAALVALRDALSPKAKLP